MTACGIPVFTSDTCKFATYGGARPRRRWLTSRDGRRFVLTISVNRWKSYKEAH
jgi:hypothetical protein